LTEVLKTSHFLKLLDKPTLSNRQNRSKSLLHPQITPSANLRKEGPNVRQGPHALLTITEGKAADKRGGVFGLLYRLTEKEDAKASWYTNAAVTSGWRRIRRET
jgi:hypothetical protein